MNIDDCRKHFTFEPEAEYHARSKTGECMSSHMLRKFAESAAGYFKLISEPPEEKKSDAFRFGTAVHCAILEPEKFSSATMSPTVRSIRKRENRSDGRQKNMRHGSPHSEKKKSFPAKSGRLSKQCGNR